MQEPPWWTLKYTLMLVGGVLVVTLAVLGWAGLLRRRVRAQTSVIRERLEHETKLESRYRDLFENANDMVYTTDQDGRLTSFNRAAERITGYSRSEALGRRLADLVAPSDIAQTEFLTRPPGDGDGDARAEIQLQTRSGLLVPVEVNVRTIRHEGQFSVVLGIGRDIRERRESEERVHQLNASLERRVAERTAELEAANRELESFSYSVSHDLRTPLRAVNNFAEILLQDYGEQLHPKAQRYLKNVAASGRRMGELVDDLLDFSRLARASVSAQNLQMSELVRHVIADFQRQDPNRRVSVKVLPLHQAIGDHSLIRQVWHNLVGNAWKFTSRREDAEIEIGSRHEGGQIIYWVKDNGAGFDMAYAEKLFGVFQRLHSDTDFPGTGVGLAVVERIVCRHNGRVWAEGQVNGGATFYFTLPDESSRKEP
jgi:PAS domain S-box-containing protein